jgi:branched-chain amino acid transport system permease protein
MGQAAFMAVGGYTSAIVITRLGFSFWMALPCSAIVAGIVGMLFGLPALKVKGFYLAMTTLAAQFVITWVIIHGGNITKATYGIAIPRPSIGGLVFDSEAKYFYLIVPITMLMGLFARNLIRTRVGRAFIAIRDNDLAAEVMGVNLLYYKTLAFVICAAYAGIAGCLWTSYIAIAHYEHYALMDSVWMLGMLIVGGMGSTMGVVFGTIFIRGLNEAVSYLSPTLSAAIPGLGGLTAVSVGLVLLGTVIILFLIFEPRGINHRWEIIKHTYRIFPFSY